MSGITSKVKRIFRKNKDKTEVAEGAEPNEDSAYPTADSSAAHPAAPHPETHEHLSNALEALVDKSSQPLTKEEIHNGSAGGTALAPATVAHAKSAWFSKFYPDETIDKLFVHEHMGNWIIIRKTGDRIFETMPIYTRIGMHLLFYGKAETALLHWGRVETLLREQSMKQGQIYDNPDPKVIYPHILAFCKTYQIDTSILLEPELHNYPSLNTFFSRKLRPDVRPITAPDELGVIVSCADCRLTVFETAQEATNVWIKGRHFTIPELLNDEEIVEEIGSDPSLAIFRLAPQDYHRYHAPVTGLFRKVTKLPGEYYTVNPQAVNEPGFDVFTANKRDVALIDATLDESGATVPVAFVSVGALLVGSITWTKEVGEPLKKGEDLGYFQYGGSTVIVVFPKGAMTFDQDILGYSKAGVETLVHVGDRIGVAGSA
ncbi:hypothetical protein DACRYDRAFT_23040 [Dacryopinax primogenitus]|uniref:Phosphatidylserine decarboxylase n=1 Tax=Dacryopinax primogenitus (strain DJM 731) TaxID=1858805 RepID=M5G9W7_DACPD|nr:uncharacterized protein DACRYDRAFT_23040 [Dacryopinax primogenitus]EJU00633.1 hypothetical protein DACRYDRAFT_23040 [Dacryopinax primogenitus]